MPAFAALPAAALEKLAAQIEEEAYPQGAVVLAEGAPADRLLIVAEGEVVVSTANGGEQVPLCRLAEGELFGEIGLLDPLRQRSARVTAVRPLLVAALARRHFQALVETHPEARASLQAAAEQAQVATLLKRASPFRRLGAETLRWLASRLEERSFAAGETVFRQGDKGDVCYLVRSGTLEIRKREHERDVAVATCTAGDVVGEAALLTEAPRDASITALEGARLLALRRSDLLQVLERERTLGRDVVALVQQRDRPLRSPRAVVRSRATADAGRVAVLEDESRPGVYEQLSAPALFAWERLDGVATVAEIAAACRETLGETAAAELPGAVARLVADGFAQAKELRPDVAAAVEPKGLVERLRRLFTSR